MPSSGGRGGGRSGHPDLGIEPLSPGTPALQADSLPLRHRGKPQMGLDELFS